MNLAATRQPSLESGETRTSNGRSHRSVRSKGSRSRANTKGTNRELMKRVKHHYYGQPPSDKSLAWAAKVLEDVLKVVPRHEDKNCESRLYLTHS